MRKMIVILLTLGSICVSMMILSNAAFAAEPKCACFKSQDFEKLMKKGWAYSFSVNEPTNKQISFNRPEYPWNQGTKGKGYDITFRWFSDEALYDGCGVSEGQVKWKEPGYTDRKYKDKQRPMPEGGPESAQCAAILDNVISSFPPI